VHRRPPEAVAVDDQPGAAPQPAGTRRRVPCDAGSEQGRAAGAAAQDQQAGRQRASAGPGAADAGAADEPRTDQRPTAAAVSRRRGHADLDRGHLRQPVRAGPGRAAPRADQVSSHRAGDAPAAAAWTVEQNDHGSRTRS
jgi:hypothetical protein